MLPAPSTRAFGSIHVWMSHRARQGAHAHAQVAREYITIDYGLFYSLLTHNSDFLSNFAAVKGLQRLWREVA